MTEDGVKDSKLTDDLIILLTSGLSTPTLDRFLFNSLKPIVRISLFFYSSSSSPSPSLSLPPLPLSFTSFYPPPPFCPSTWIPLFFV